MPAMSPRPALSVIVTVYSRDRYLSEMFGKLFLSGLRLNAGRRVELVLVDDASPLEAGPAARGS